MKRRRFDRLVHTGNVLIDVVMTVPGLPAHGGDVVATSAAATTGGAFNAMAAAVRLGLPAAYAGAHGTGPRADRARRDLATEGIALLTGPNATADTGFDICLVDDLGERTFVTSPGAESTLGLEQLATVSISARDVVLVSGYSLAYPANRAALDSFLDRLPDSVTIVFDPGPLVAGVPAETIDRFLGRADWITCNAAEAAALTAASSDVEAAAALSERASHAGILVRADARGTLLLETGVAPLPVPALLVEVVDSTGAGDVHTGAFLAALAAGESPIAAVAVANAAAAFAVTRRGPAAGPTSPELAAFRARLGESHQPS
jgi:sugar/nucleoside kinase (ribokinase family)